MSAEELRTQFAQRAITIADTFAVQVGQIRVEGPMAYRVEMVVPEGCSTGGGARSVQHLRLVPIVGGSAIVIGSCDQIEMTAVLRSWELLAEQYGQRYRGAKLPVDAVEYGKLLLRMEEFFRERTMRVDKLDVVRAAAPPAPPVKMRVARSAPAPSLPWVFALLAAGAALGSAATFLILR